MKQTVITKKVLKKPSKEAMDKFVSSGVAPKVEYTTTTFILHNDFPQADVHIQKAYDAFLQERVTGNSDEEFVGYIIRLYGAGKYKAHL